MDYFSKYPEVARLSSKNSEAVIVAMKDIVMRSDDNNCYSRTGVQRSIVLIT